MTLEQDAHTFGSQYEMGVSRDEIIVMGCMRCGATVAEGDEVYLSYFMAQAIKHDRECDNHIVPRPPGTVAWPVR